MAQAAQAPVSENNGLFHMIGRIWSTGTTLINAIHHLASTAEMHAKHVELTTQVELSSELNELRARLNSIE
jgi:hypothetical protein